MASSTQEKITIKTSARSKKGKSPDAKAKAAEKKEDQGSDGGEEHGSPAQARRHGQRHQRSHHQVLPVWRQGRRSQALRLAPVGGGSALLWGAQNSLGEVVRGQHQGVGVQDGPQPDRDDQGSEDHRGQGQGHRNGTLGGRRSQAEEADQFPDSGNSSRAVEDQVPGRRRDARRHVGQGPGVRGREPDGQAGLLDHPRG